MIKIHLVSLLLLFPSAQLLCQDLTSAKIIKEYLDGKMIVVNNYAFYSGDSSVFTKLILGKIKKFDYLDSANGKAEFGTLASKGALRMEIEDVTLLKGEEYQMIDASVLKYFVKEKQLFYFIDGLPNRNFMYAMRGLVNKKVKEVKLLPANQATAIWGKEAEYGALIINTVGDLD